MWLGQNKADIIHTYTSTQAEWNRRWVIYSYRYARKYPCNMDKNPTWLTNSHICVYAIPTLMLLRYTLYTYHTIEFFPASALFALMLVRSLVSPETSYAMLTGYIIRDMLWLYCWDVWWVHTKLRATPHLLYTYSTPLFSKSTILVWPYLRFNALVITRSSATWFTMQRSSGSWNGSVHAPSNSYAIRRFNQNNDNGACSAWFRHHKAIGTKFQTMPSNVPRQNTGNGG